MTQAKFGSDPVIVRRKLDLYSGTQVPIIAGDVYKRGNLTECVVISNKHVNSAAIPVFMALAEFRHTWDGTTRGTFSIKCIDKTGREMILTPTDLAGLGHQHVSAAPSGVPFHPFVRVTYEKTFPDVPARFRQWANDEAMKRAVTRWHKDPEFLNPGSRR